MICDNPVRFYRLSEGDIAAARKGREIEHGTPMPVSTACIMIG
jgi:hypothetical protein